MFQNSNGENNNLEYFQTFTDFHFDQNQNDIYPTYQDQFISSNENNLINNDNILINKNIYTNPAYQTNLINNYNNQPYQNIPMTNNIKLNQINGMTNLNDNYNTNTINNINIIQPKSNETIIPFPNSTLVNNLMALNHQENIHKSQSLNRTNSNNPEFRKNERNQIEDGKKNKATNRNKKPNKNSNKNTNTKKNNNSKINPLKLNEQILLRNQKQALNKDLDIKTHFDLEVTKERFLFNYKKVLKIAIPLLSHYEMPSGCEYKSPQLSPDGQFLSCISKAETDIVFVWDLDDLYWYKYKFFIAKVKVDCIAFTPDSKSILVIYKKENPILYSLKNGSKILE